MDAAQTCCDQCLTAAYGQIAARAEPDSHPDVNVLAVLHTRNRINEWLTENVTPWPHEGLAFAKDPPAITAIHGARKRGSKPSSARALAIETTPSSSAML